MYFNMLIRDNFRKIGISLISLCLIFAFFLPLTGTVYAEETPISITYDVNGGGTFSSGNSQNTVSYDSSLLGIERISKTSNVNDDGSPTSNGYGNGLSVTDVVTIEGAPSLEVTITYQTENVYYDWVAVYDGSVTPTAGNYSSSVSKNLGSTTKTTKTFTVQGDTAQFFFISNSQNDGYFGYYATIKPQNVLSGSYEEPVPSNQDEWFIGWYTDEACTEGKEFDINTASSDVTVYAKYGDAPEIYSGTCGDCSWSIYKDGLLKIFPSNGREGYLASNDENLDDFWPWSTQRSFIKKVIVEDGVKVGSNGSLHKFFYKMENCTEFDLTGLDISNAVDISYMFYNCSSATELNVSNFNTSNVANMSYLFFKCSSLQNLDVINLDTANVTNMSGLFCSCKNLTTLDLSNFNTEKVTDMSSMFSSCTNLTKLNLSNFNTSNVTTMQSMFSSCTNLTELDLSNFNTSNVTTMQSMFYNCENLTELDLSNFSTSNVTTMSSMFDSCTNLKKLNLKNFDTIAMTSGYPFYYSFRNLLNLEEITFSEEFLNTLAKKYTYFSSGGAWRKIKDKDGNSITDGEVVFTSRLLEYANIAGTWIREPGCSWEITGDGILKIFPTNGISGYLLSPDSMTASESFWPWYQQRLEIKEVIVENGVKGSGNVSYMFAGLENCTKIDFKGIDLSETSVIRYMFKNCKSIVKLDLSNFYLSTSKTSYMTSIFEGCSNLEELVLNDTFKFTYDHNIDGTSWTKIKNVDGTDVLEEIKVNKADLITFSTNNLMGGTWIKAPTCSWEVTSDGILRIYPTNGIVGYLDANTSDSSNFWPWYSYRYNITKVIIEDGVIATGSLSYIFDEFRNCTEMDLSGLDTTAATSMYRMFYTCLSLTELDISNFDTSNVTNMSYMFYYCSALTELDVSSFDTSSVANMSYMFKNCTKLRELDLSNFDTSNVTNITEMFNSCSSLARLDLSGWTNEKITDMNHMFYYCSALTELDLTSFNTSNITDMNYMFAYCSKLTNLDLTNFNTSNVTNMSYMFSNCSVLTDLNVSSFNTSNVTNMSCMFYNCRALAELDLSNFDTSLASTNTSSFITNCSALEKLILGNNFTLGKGLSFTSNYLWVKLKEVDGTYTNDETAYSFYEIMRFDNTTNPCIAGTWERTDLAFCAAQSGGVTWEFNDKTKTLKLYPTNGISGTLADIINSSSAPWYSNYRYRIEKVIIEDGVCLNTKANYLFRDLVYCREMDLSKLNTSKTTSMKGMFYSCVGLTELDLSSFDTSNVTDMSSMFYMYPLEVNGVKMDTNKLSKINLSSFNTSKVTDMSYMFTNCEKLKMIDISNFNSSSITSSLSMMFNGCNKLETLVWGQNFTANLSSSIGISNQYKWKMIKDKDGNMVNNGEEKRIYELTQGTWKKIMVEPKYKRTSGECSWEISKSGVLEIYPTYGVSGELGEIVQFRELYESGNAYYIRRMPWYGHRDIITKVVVSNGVDYGKASYLFTDLSKCKEIDIRGLSTRSMSNMFENCVSLENIYFGNKPSLTYMAYAFKNCKSLTTLNLNEIDFSKVTNMSYMFQDCSNLTSLDVSNFDTSSATNMYAMFSGCESLTSLDLSNFNTSNVTYMGSMFSGCESLTSLDLSNFNTNSVTDMNSMFADCTSLTSLDLTSFNTSSVTNMDDMFSECYKLTSLDLSGFDMSNVTSSENMFASCLPMTLVLNDNFSIADTGLSRISTWIKIKNSDGTETNDETMYSGAQLLSFTNETTPNIGGTWELVEIQASGTSDGVSWVIYKNGLLDVYPTNGTSGYLGYVYGTGYWSNYSELIKNIVIRNGVIAKSSSTNIFEGLRYCESIDLMGLDLSKLSDFSSMFKNCPNLKTITGLDIIDTSKVTKMNNMFSGCSSLTELDVSNFSTSNVTSMGAMFSGCSGLTELDVSNFSTSNVTSMNAMFSGCSNLTELDVSNFSTSNVTAMGYMFYGCSGLSSLDLSSFDTSSVVNMSYMFENCNNIKELNLSNFNTANVINMRKMFYNCRKLTTLNIVGFNLDKIDPPYINQSIPEDSKFPMGDIFSGTPNLTKIYLPEYWTFKGYSNYAHHRPGLGGQWVKTRNIDGTKTYSRTAYYSSEMPTGTAEIGGLWARNGVEDDYITNPDGSIEFISNDNEWVVVSDEIWTYTFKVFDDSLVYYLFEELMNGYVSEAMAPYYITVQNNMATITNKSQEEAQKYGGLIISKTVNGNPSDITEFEFTITLNGEKISGTQIFNGVVFDEGVAKIFLKNGDRKEFTLPAGTTYHVTEKPYSDYESNIEDSMGAIESNVTAEVNAINTYINNPVSETKYVNLRLKKTAENNSNKETEFIINMLFSNMEENKIYLVSNGDTFKTMENGTAFYTAKFKENDELLILNLPIGAMYQITEQAGPYISSYQIVNNTDSGNIVKNMGVNTDINIPLSTEIETVELNEEIEVKFHNMFTTIQNLTISKNTKKQLRDGSLVDYNTDDKFEFTITFKNMNEGATFTSSIGRIIADEYGEAYKTFYLKNGESAEFYNIPAGVEYIVEESAKDNYKPSFLVTGLDVIQNYNEAEVGKKLSTMTESIQIEENAEVIFTNIKENPKKAIRLTKSIDTQNNPNIIPELMNNRMYYLDGAEYELVINGEVVETLVTDVNGEATSTQVFADGTTGTIREVKAPDGFFLDEREYSFTIDNTDGEEYCEVAVSDIPTFDPTVIRIQKKDAITGVNPQGGATFEGAVFKYEYYDNINWDGYPTRTWYFKTNAMGLHGYHPNYLADGYTSDELYTSGNNVYTIPLGSVKITEVLSPAGYKTMPVLYATITQESMGAPARWRFTQETLEFLTTGTDGLYEGIEPIDEEKFGSLVVQKAVNESGFAKPTDDATFAGCEFTIYNKSANPVKIGDNEITQSGEACMVITVGADGKATSGAVLPVGTYEVKETKGNEFYQCNTAWSYTFTVDGTEDNPMFTTICKNDAVIFTQNITLKKVVSNSDVLFGNEVFTINVEFSGLEANKTYNMSNGNSFTSDASGCATYTARIAHNEEVVFQDIPVGANYKFTEIAGQYTASYSIVDSNKE